MKFENFSFTHNTTDDTANSAIVPYILSTNFLRSRKVKPFYCGFFCPIWSIGRFWSWIGTHWQLFFNQLSSGSTQESWNAQNKEGGFIRIYKLGSCLYYYEFVNRMKMGWRNWGSVFQEGKNDEQTKIRERERATMFQF